MDLTASQEDYLEAIYHIIAEKKVARAKEVAKSIKVSQASVTEAFRSLSQKKLINYAPYEVITLTPKGETVARDIIRRHEVLKDFFVKILAIDEGIADDGACKIEHTAPREIIEKLIKFISFIEECPRCGEDLLENFKTYCSKGKQEDRCRECVSQCLE